MRYTKLREWLKALVEYDGKYETADDPKLRTIAMRDVGTGKLFEVAVVDVSSRATWGIELPQHFIELFRTPSSRKRLAHILTTGDHCLRFD